MIYNPVTQLCNLTTPLGYRSIDANSVKIFFNYDLYSMFYDSFDVKTLGYNLNSKKDIEFIISDRNLSSTNYIMNQEINTLYQFWDMQSIYFSSTMALRHEEITTTTSDNRSLSQPILTDFIPILGADRSQLIYNANPFRLINMLGVGELNRIQFQVYYSDRYGVQHPLTLLPGDSMSCKFQFSKK